MFDFLIPKTKIKAWTLREVPIEKFEVVGIGQINPYCDARYDSGIFATVLSFANDSEKYDEREGLVLAKNFTVKKCPKCKKLKLIPTRININLNATYVKHEEEIVFNAFEEYPTRRHAPSLVEAFCNHCSACFEIKIKLKDCWVKEAKRIKERDLLSGSWEEYFLE